MLKFIFVLVLFGHSTCYGDTSESDWRSRGWYRPRRNYPGQSQSHNAFGIRTGASESQKLETSFSPNQGSFGSISINQRQTSSPFGDFSQKYQTQNERTSHNQNSNRNSFQSNGIQSQTTSFGTNNAQNYQNGNTFGARNSGSSLENGYNSNAQSRNSFETSFSNSKLDYAQNTQNQNTFGFGVQPQNQNSFRTSQNQNSFGNSFTQNNQNQNAFRPNYNQQAQTQNSFLSSYQKAQSRNAFGSYSQSAQRQSTFGSSFAQNPFPYQNVTNNFNIGRSSSSFGRGENIFKGPDYLPPYIAPGYLPSKDPTTTTRRPFYTTTTTRRPFYTTTTTRRPFYTTTTTRRPFYTTTTTRRPFYTTTTTRRPTPTYLPAMAMRVPLEPEDGPTTPKPSTPFDEESSTLDEMKVTRPNNVAPAMAMRVPPEPEDDPTTPKPTTPFDEESSTLDEMKVTRPNNVAPAMAMRVPPEPEDDPTTPKPSTPFDEESSTLDEMKVTRLNKVAPAMAMRVPPEPEPDPTPITTTTITPRPTTTTTTTPPPTTTTTTTTPRPTTTTTTTTTTTPRPTTTTTTTTTPPPTTTTTTTTTPRPTTTTTTTTTPPPTTTTTTTTTPRPTTTTTTTTTPSPTTTTTTTTTPRPTTTTTTTSTTPPPTTTTTTTPPPTTTTPALTTPELDRMLIEETPKTTTTTVPPFNPYKAPTYLPPENTTSPPPSPALAVPVPSEPECDPLDPKTYPYPVIGVDERFTQDPCTYVPVRTTTKKPFVGPAYLPPVAARVGRSPKTLRLGDVEGARPVWHVGLYTKTTAPYKQICGGSIVRMDVVITAAHCVWNDDTLLQPAENYAVGGNKIYRPWTESHDKRAQQSDIREIIVPPRYRGGKTSFQDDIAILRLVTPFSYARGLRPVCVNFDDDFDAEQLSEGNSGTIAGWGYTDDIGSPTQFLLWLELPYVDIEKCIEGADVAFLKYITSDKICAGENHTGKALCKGDSGGGLVFWHSEGELVTPYLRGVASASARADNKECNVNVVGGFTQITAHRRFLQKHVPDIDQNCRYHYFN